MSTVLWIFKFADTVCVYIYTSKDIHFTFFVFYFLVVADQLTQNLGMIEEIDGYLKIVRSFPLMSLEFLKSLSVIRGRILENNKYVRFINKISTYLIRWFNFSVHHLSYWITKTYKISGIGRIGL